MTNTPDASIGEEMIFGTAVEKALKNVQSLQEKRRNVADRIVALKSRMAVLESPDEDLLLNEILSQSEADDIAGSPRRKERAEIEETIADLTAAQKILAKKLGAAIITHAEKQAEIPREKARKLEADLGRHVAETERLLQLLHDHDGVHYAIPAAPILPPGVTTARPVEIPYPRARWMADQIGRLLAEANSIESAARNKVTHGGSVEVSTLEELLAVAENPLSVTPFPVEIKDWFKRAFNRPPETWANLYEDKLPDGDKVYRLVWDPTGVIVENESTPVWIIADKTRASDTWAA